MKKNRGIQKKRKNTLSLVTLLLILISTGVVALNILILSSSQIPVLSYIGFVTDTTSTVTVTQSGTAGIILTDSAIAFGSGYYNATCTTGYSTLDSNLTYGNGTLPSILGAAAPYCWVNTTATLVSARDSHTLQNNGSVKVNVSASSNQLDAETFFCGASRCPLTAIAEVSLLSNQSEVSSCSTTLTGGYEDILTQNTNATVGLCDALDFQDTSDTILVFVNMTVPRDATASAKTLTITYEALAS